MHRRQVLAATAALLPAAAGCVGSPAGSGNLADPLEMPTATLSMDAVGDAAVAAEFAHHELPDDERALLARVVDEGAATVGWYQEPPLHTGRPLLHEGVVHRLSRTVVERRPATNYAVKVDIPQTTPDEAATVRFGDLPAADRAVFEREGFAGGEVVGVGTVFTYTPGQEADSVLVPEPEYDYVAWSDGTTAEWVVDDSWTTEQRRYRYQAERVATASEYGAGIRREHAWTLEGLPAAEREIVRTAIEEEQGYTVASEATPSPAFESLVDRFRPHDEVAVHREPDPLVGGQYLVRHEGSVYWTELRVSDGVAVEATPTSRDATVSPDGEAGSSTPSPGPTRTPDEETRTPGEETQTPDEETRTPTLAPTETRSDD